MPGARGGVAAATWFEDAFGFKELRYEETRARFELRGDVLVSRANSRSFHVGPFDVLSLEELRGRLAPPAGAEARARPSGGLVFRNVVGDARELHANSDNADAVFQVASQFNCLEMNEPGARPEDGVTRYSSDATQGPACAIACPGATVFRNYFVNGKGQGGKNQVDCLSGVGELLQNAKEGYWRMANGYCLPTKPGSIARVSKAVQADALLAEAVRSRTQVGIHWDTEVRRGGHHVSQVFCSALPVAYAKTTPSKDWQPFAQCVLDAVFDATLAAGAILAAKRGTRVKVYLTPVGGGAFGNRSQWICDALRRALQSHAAQPLDVMLVSFATLPRGPYVTLEQGWAASQPSGPAPRGGTAAEAAPPARKPSASPTAAERPAAPRPKRAAAGAAAPARRRSTGSLAEKLTAAFAAFDANGDGVIDERELTAVLGGVDPKLFTPASVRELFRAADADHDGLIHYAEFAAWICGEDSGVASAVLGSQPRLSSGGEPGEAARSAKPPSRTGDSQLVLGRYAMGMTDDDFMGEGASSLCRKGVDSQTSKQVAVKVYKARDQGRDVALVKLRRQIEVLQELGRPFQKPGDPRLWNEELAATSPERIFMQLLDYSRGPDGRPGPDPADDQLYVVTELAQYSLKDYIATRRDENRPMSIETVRGLVKAIMLVTAGLHAKGLVHLDLKPENLMVFDGVLKLIDVDGCVRIGSTISIEDDSLSFSPVYCAPEWANFLIDEEVEEPCLTASPALDVWSIGMTLMELVTLDPVLRSQYASFFRHGRDREESSFLFFDWLASLQRPPVPRRVQEADGRLGQLLAEHLLVCDAAGRRSLAECLRHPFLAGADLRRSGTGPLRADAADGRPPGHRRRARGEDTSDGYVLKGTLWKLNAGGDPKDPSQWLQRDVWLANSGALCYFSLKDHKRLQLMDAQLLHAAAVERFRGGAREHALQIHAADHSLVFACDSEAECERWRGACEQARRGEDMRTMRLGNRMAKELRKQRLKVRNRRQALDEKMRAGQGYKPRFKGFLWKLRADGRVDNDSDWFRREMWLSVNGSLVYWSEKEERELVYYTAPDIAHATVTPVEAKASKKAWRFEVRLASAGGLEFQPGDFAADSREERDAWLRELARFRC